MSQAPEVKARTVVRDVMRITWHEAIPMGTAGKSRFSDPRRGRAEPLSSMLLT